MYICTLIPSTQEKVKYFLLIFISLLFHLSGFGQCKFEINNTIPVGADFFVQGSVNGLINNDLASPLQGLCGIEINFEHDFIGNLQIELISPNGQSISLIGPTQIGNFTNGTEWDIQMNPCSDLVSPDGGFPNTWSNGASWTIGANYTGSYYPYSGCLEDFDSGSANGIWQLHIINGAFYDGLIKSFTLKFCDPTGISCLPCDSKAGIMAVNDVKYCKNDTGLGLFIPSINFPLGEADVLYYDYKYVIILNGIIIEITATPDWTLLSEGIYEIYGISYLKSYDPIIQTYIGNNFGNLQTLIASTSICGQLTPDSLSFTINNFYDLPLKDLVICKNDTLTIGQKKYTSTQLIRDTLSTIHGCDSIVNINLIVAALNVDILTDTIDCINKIVKLDTSNFISNINTFQILGYSWKDEAGNIISNNGSVDVTVSGDYSLVITALFGSLVCSYSFDAPVVEQMTVPMPPVLLPVNPCNGMESIFIVSSDTLRNDLHWTFQGNPNVIFKGDTAFVTWTSTGNYQVCAFGTNQCGSSDTVCQTIIVNPNPGFTFKFDSLTCDGSFAINLLGSSASLSWNGDIQEINYVVNADGTSVNGFLLPGINTTTIKYSGSIGGCDANGELDIMLLDPPIISGIKDTVICGPSDISFDINYNYNVGTLYYTWNGIQSILPLSGMGGILQIQVIQSGTLVIDSLTTLFRTCDINAAQSFNIVLNNPPFAVIEDTISLCNTFNSNGVPKYFLPDFIQSGDKSGNWNISGLPGVTILNDSIDLSKLPTGYYSINYSTNSALVPCLEKNYKTILKIIDCTCPVPADISPSLYNISICSNYGIIDLDSLFKPQVSVLWNILDATGTVVPLPSHFFDTNNTVQNPQKFVLKTTSDWFGQCADSLILSLNIDQAKYAGDDNSLNFCIEDRIKIGLDTILSNVLNAGNWYAFPQSFPGIIQAFNPGKRELDISKLGSGSLLMFSVARSNNVCKNDTARLDILINRKPKIEVTGSAFLDCTTMETELFLNGRNINDYLVSWSFNNNVFHTSNGRDSQFVGQTGNYYFYVEDNQTGCLDTSIFIVNNAADSIKEADYDIVIDCTDHTGDLFINTVTGGSPPFSYSIDSNTFITYAQFYDLESGKHSIEILDSKNCNYEFSFEVANTTSNILELGPDIYITIGDTVNYEIPFSKELIDSIIVSIDGFTTEFGTQKFEIFPSKTEFLSVWLTDIYGCEYEDELTIFVDNEIDIFVPNIFSPNGDGINDRFYIPKHPQIEKIIEFKIFDRWGNNVFGANQFYPGEESIGWDGLFNGRPMDPAVFVYFIRYSTSDGAMNFKKGSFTLIR